MMDMIFTIGGGREVSGHHWNVVQKNRSIQIGSRTYDFDKDGIKLDILLIITIGKQSRNYQVTTYRM